MKRRGYACSGLLFAACCGPLAAAYSNLIATADGSSVYFEAKTSFSGTRWYRARMDAGRLAVTDAGLALADISEDGTTIATSSFGERSCGFAGSTCWTAPACGATLTIVGTEGSVGEFGRKTFVRLSRSGRLAWIEQTTVCRGLGTPVSPERQGLYEVPALRQAAPTGGLGLACRRAGRRLITNRDQVLVRAANTQLSLIDRSGVHQIRHQYGADEAVIDAGGRNVVYTDGSPGPVHWIDLDRQTEETVGIGAAPALSDDASMLAFLAPGGSLILHRRETGQATRLADNVLEFALSGSGRYVFAVTGENRLLRIEAATAIAETWLEPFPEIRDASVGLGNRDPESCPLICYSTPEPLLDLGRGSLLVLGGSHFPDGWSARVAGIERPLGLLSREAAWFQVPSDAADGRQSLEVVHPGHPLRFSASGQVSERFISCFGALHQGFDRIVSAADPAFTGEIVHVFLTGLAGVQPVADGVSNPADRLIPVVAPPALGGDGALEPLFFGLAPGLIGIQQLDLRILGPILPGVPLFREVRAAPNCEAPPANP